MNIYCSGCGRPTVILDAGLSGGTLDWRFVQPLVATRARVCSYDRAGMRFSDATVSPRDAVSVVAILHALLREAGIPPPYVLVGHSIAGLYVRAYVARYPHDVRGLVLVDPATDDEDARFHAIAPARAVTTRREQRLACSCERLAALSMLRAKTPAFAKCIGDPDPALDAESNATNAALREKPGYWMDLISEWENAERSQAEVRDSDVSYGDMPLIVLTRTKTDADPQTTPSQRARLSTAWKEMHAAIARRSTRGQNIDVPGAGHYVQLDRPATVVTAIDRILDEQSRR